MQISYNDCILIEFEEGFSFFHIGKFCDKFKSLVLIVKIIQIFSKNTGLKQLKVLELTYILIKKRGQLGGEC